MKYAVSIDIGGTNVRVARVGEDYRVAERVSFPTPKTPDECIARITEAVDAFDKKDLVGIGMCCPGPLDLVAGLVIYTPNLDRSWFGYPLTKNLSEATGLPVILENDANLAALAEAVIGKGKGKKSLLYLTVSTGVGLGIVLDGKIFRGAHGFAGEMANACVWEEGPVHGELTRGSIEAVASGTALLSRGRSAGLPVSSAKDVVMLSERGNPTARRLTTEAERYMANFIGILIGAFDPEIVIIGGSVALNVPGYAENIEDMVKQKALPAVAPHVKVVLSDLDGDNGLIGGAAVVFTETE